MKKVTKLVALLIILVLVAVPLAACSGGGGSADNGNSVAQTPAQTPAKSEEPITLTFMGGSHLASVCEVVLKDYLNAHPNVTIEYEKYSYAEYPTKMGVQLSSGDSTPDIMLIHDLYFRQFVEAGWLLDLTPMVDTTQLLPVLGNAMKDGKIYGIPNQVVNGNVFMYRQDIYDELGLTVPTTWDEYFEQALKLKESGYFAGALLPSNATDAFLSYMQMLGGSVFDSEGNISLDKGAEAITMLQKGLDAGIFHPSVQGSSDGDYWPAFNEGLIAAFPSHSSNAAYYETNLDPAGKGGFGNLRVAPGVRFTAGGKTSYVHAVEYFAINAKSEHIEAAKELITYLAMSEEACLKFSNVNEDGVMAKYTTAYIPGIAKVVEAGSEGFAAFGGQQVISEFAKIYENDKPTLSYKDARTQEAQALIQVILGETLETRSMTPEEAIEEMKRQLSQI